MPGGCATNDMPIRRAATIMGPKAMRGGDPIIFVEMSSDKSELTFFSSLTKFLSRLNV